MNANAAKREKKLNIKSKNSLFVYILNDNLHRINGVKRKIHGVFIPYANVNFTTAHSSAADQH